MSKIGRVAMLDRRILIIAFAACGLILAGSIAAPVLTHFGFISLSTWFYWAYSFICHQIDDRSIMIMGEKMAFCARDFGTFSGLIFSSIITFVRKENVRRIELPVFLALAAPLILDGGVQLLSETFYQIGIMPVFYSSNNLLRITTGFMCGIGIWFYLVIHTARHVSK